MNAGKVKLPVYKDIVVPLDGSVLARKALPHAMDLAKRYGARLTLLTVIEPFHAYPVAVDAYEGMCMPRLTQDVEVEQWKSEIDRERSLLHHITKELQAEGIDAREVVLEGDPASLICDYAQQINADLIVMTTHGRTGLQRWVYGSVADKVLRGAQVPVLLIRAHHSNT